MSGVTMLVLAGQGTAGAASWLDAAAGGQASAVRKPASGCTPCGNASLRDCSCGSRLLRQGRAGCESAWVPAADGLLTNCCCGCCCGSATILSSRCLFVSACVCLSSELPPALATRAGGLGWPAAARIMAVCRHAAPCEVATLSHGNHPKGAHPAEQQVPRSLAQPITHRVLVRQWRHGRCLVQEALQVGKWAWNRSLLPGCCALGRRELLVQRRHRPPGR